MNSNTQQSQDLGNQIAALVFAALKDQIQAFVKEAVATELKEARNDESLDDKIEEFIEAGRLNNALEPLIDKRMDELLESDEFDNAVSSVVENLNFEINVRSY